MSPFELVIWFMHWVYMYRTYRHMGTFIYIYLWEKNTRKSITPDAYLKSSFWSLPSQPRKGGPAWGALPEWSVVILSDIFYRTWNSIQLDDTRQRNLKSQYEPLPRWLANTKHTLLHSHLPYHSHCYCWKGMVPLSSEVTSRCKSKHSAISILSLTGSGRDNQERKRLVLAGAIREDFTEHGTWMGCGGIWRGGDKCKQSRQDSTIGGGRGDHSLCV